MNGRSGNRILVWALGLSLAIHLVFAIVARTMPPAQAEPEGPTPAQIVHIVPPSPTPPPPTPRPHARQISSHPSHTSTHASISVHPPHVVVNGGGSVISGPPVVANPGPPGAGDVASSATPSPAPACSDPYVAAHVIDPVSPETPEDAAGIAATAQVQVTLDDRGRVTDARMYASTGTLSLDRAALDAARRSTYAPQIADCQPTGGSYLFKVDFTS